MLNPNCIGALHNDIAIGPVRAVKVMDPNHPDPVYNVELSVVNYDAGAEYGPGNLDPRRPPGRIVAPVIRRCINAILPPQNILHGVPVINIDVVAVIRMIAAPAVGIPFHRFHDDLFSVKVFVSHDLKDGLSPANDLDFDNSHVLHLITAHQGLQHNGVEITLLPMFNPDVVNPAVVVQVEVVNPVFL